MHLFRKLVTPEMPLLAPVFTLVALTGSAATTKTVAPAVVFENTIAPYVYTDAGEAGDTVQLAGSERLITQISIGVVCNGLRPVNTDDFQMRLWTADGPNGTAGRLLWQSDYLMNVPLAGPVQLLTFSVPGIEVPDTLIWSVNHT